MRPIWRHILALSLLCAVVTLAYLPSLKNDFVWDDDFQISGNPYVHSHQPLSKLLFTDVWGYMRGGDSVSNYYRPLQILTYRWTAQLGGLNPLPFHAASLVFNTLACLAGYVIFFQLTQRIALAFSAAILFALHPIHSEAVVWIASLPELGCALFYFAAFACFVQWQRSRASRAVLGKQSRKAPAAAAKSNQFAWLAASCVALFVALLWKEMALTFPVIVFAAIWFGVANPPVGELQNQNSKGRVLSSLRGSLPFWGVVGVYAAIRVAVLGYFSKVQIPWQLSPFQYGLSVLTVAAEYCIRLVAPIPLNAYHVFHPVLSVLDWRWIAAAILLIVIVGMIGYTSRRAPLCGFALSWILLTLAPVLSLRSIGLNVFAERYLYIPSLGFALLVVWTAAHLLKRFAPRTQRMMLVTALALLSAAAIAEIRQRIPDWRDDRTFYAHTLAESPQAAQIRIFYATILRNDGDTDGAQEQYELALQDALAQKTNTQVASAYLGLAFVAWRHQRYDQALDFVDRGLGYADLPGLSVERGILLLQVGRTDEAQQVLENVTRTSPYNQAALNALGLVHLARHDPAKASEYFGRAVESNPRFAQGYYNLGRAYLQLDRSNDALLAFERATELQPGSSIYRSNYGSALARAGRYDEARVQLQQALQIEPRNSTASAILNQLDQIQSTKH